MNKDHKKEAEALYLFRIAANVIAEQDECTILDKWLPLNLEN